MFFVLSKILWGLFIPFHLIAILLLAGFILLFKKEGLGRVLIAVALAMIFILGLPFVPYYMVSQLERRISRAQSLEKAYGVIVLAGMTDMRMGQNGEMDLNEHAERIIEAVRFLRSHPGKKLILTGGSGNLDQSQNLREADRLKALAFRIKKKYYYRERLANTHEHPVMLSKIIDRDKDYILMTSATICPALWRVFVRRSLRFYLIR